MLKWAFNPVLRCGKIEYDRDECIIKAISFFSGRPAGWEEKRSSISRGDALQKSGLLSFTRQIKIKYQKLEIITK